MLLHEWTIGDRRKHARIDVWGIDAVIDKGRGSSWVTMDERIAQWLSEKNGTLKHLQSYLAGKVVFDLAGIGLLNRLFDGKKAGLNRSFLGPV